MGNEESEAGDLCSMRKENLNQGRKEGRKDIVILTLVIT